MATILVTGVGGGSGLATLRILNRFGCYITVAVDSDQYATGLQLGDYNHVVSTASSPTFISEIKNICSKHQVDAIFPNVDEELEIFATHFAEAIISPKETIQICSDKLKLWARLYTKIAMPSHYCLDYIGDIFYPIVVKPKIGRGSRNVYVVKSYNELLPLLTFLELNQKLKKTDLIFQEYLPGTEYTIDSLFHHGKLILCVPRKRLQTKDGISIVGETVTDIRLFDIVKQIGKYLEFNGPINIQVKEDQEGVPKLVEINPRLSGGLPITYSAGVNLPDLAYKLFRGEHDFSLVYYQNKITHRYLTEI